ISAVLRSVVFLMTFNLCMLFFLHIVHDMSRKVFLLTWLIYALLIIVIRYFMKKYLLHRAAGFKDARAYVIITDQEHLMEITEVLMGDIFRSLFITGAFLDALPEPPTGKEIVPILGNAENACDYICRNWVDEVFLYMPRNPVLEKTILARLKEMGVPVHHAVTKLEAYKKEEDDQEVEMFDNFVVQTCAIRVVAFGEVLLKRLIDIIGGLAGCLITALLFLILGPLIKLSSPGPVFYSQDRIGRNGQIFRMYKFRSMVPDADEKKNRLQRSNEGLNGYTFKIAEDPRIIGSGKHDRKGRPKGIGYFIRRTSLDEFPQFFNVLKGDMSIVGTRPPLPEEWDRYEYHHRARLGIRPGITGLWQVNERSDVRDFEEVIQYDTEYIHTWSILLDLKIIVLTIGKVLKADGK
ncbi:MAG: sugar transferase, partial [Blautia sp.]|nr:sugar transferase [Blautia sp.]